MGDRRDGTVMRLVLLLLVVWLLWQLRGVVLLVFGAAIVAALLRAFSDPLTRATGLSERVAVPLVAVLLLLVLALCLWALGEPLARQLQELRTALPRAWSAAREWLEKSAFGLKVLELGDDVTRDFVIPWARLAGVATVATGALADVVLIVLMGVYLAVDPGLYKRGLLRLVPPARREAVGDALGRSGDGLKRWLAGQGVGMLVVGLTVGIGLALLGMPVAPALGFIAGLLEFVPFLGAIASALLSVLVAFAQGPQQALYVAIFFIVVQQFEGNVVVPFVQRWAVHLPPVLSLLAVVVFGALFGVPGVVFGTPLMVVTLVLVDRLYVGAIESSSAGSPQ
jgi:predicted PurR-regulated permease PerM